MSESSTAIVVHDAAVSQLDHLKVIFERYPNPEITRVHLDAKLVVGNEQVEYTYDGNSVVLVRRYGVDSERSPEPLAYALATALFEGVPGIVSTNYNNLGIGNFELTIPKGRAFDDTTFEDNILVVFRRFFGLTDDQVVRKVENASRLSRGYGYGGADLSELDGALDDAEVGELGAANDPGYYASMLSDYSDPIQLKAALVPYGISDPEERSMAIAKMEAKVPANVSGASYTVTGRRALVDRLAELGAVNAHDVHFLLSGGDELDDLNPDYIHLLEDDASDPTV